MINPNALITSARTASGILVIHCSTRSVIFSVFFVANFHIYNARGEAVLSFIQFLLQSFCTFLVSHSFLWHCLGAVALIDLHRLVQSIQSFLCFLHIDYHRSYLSSQHNQTRLGTRWFLDIPSSCHADFDDITRAFGLPCRQGSRILYHLLVQVLIVTPNHYMTSRTARSMHPPVGTITMFGRSR
jgi:hypothetical protein